jgi:uncharacterized protein (DUF1684 family)
MASADSYTREIENWRAGRLQRLQADGGWLTVAGLFWLKDGVNTIGTASSNDFVLRADSAPAKLGRFEFSSGKTRFVAEPGARVTLSGKPVSTVELRPDTSGHKDELATGDLRMFIIKRGERYAVRLIDHQSEYRRHFTGLQWFPISPEFKVMARWVAYSPHKTIPIPNILGETEHLPCPGYAEFRLEGQTLRLEPVLEDNRLFFIFRDRTAGSKTYGAGRFLYTDLARDGKLTIDFNTSYNPPCAFTPFATCPLPPKQNQLPVAIEAGELKYH